MKTHDIDILRELATEYTEIAALPVQEERRILWRQHFSLHPTRIPILATYGMWNVWCRDTFGNQSMQCTDPFYQEYERWFRMQIFHHGIGDDYICEPWIPLTATYNCRGGIYGEAWGAEVHKTHTEEEGGAWSATAPLADWKDIAKLRPPPHSIDEETTSQNLERLHAAIGDILEIDLQRGPILYDFAGDISTTLAGLRGLEQIMIDMYESPRELHSLLAFLRDGVVANQDQAEAAGDISLTIQRNQAMPYSEELEDRTPNARGRKRKEIWGFFAAQEFTLISPEFHEQFLLEYQLPIMEKYGLMHYGCCEDLTNKITMLRRIPNLRSIAVTPTANVPRCAEQIQKDYVISWRPSPADMVCTSWDESRIRRVLGAGLDACRDGVRHVLLKDVETLQGDTDRLRRWTDIARSVAEKHPND